MIRRTALIALAATLFAGCQDPATAQKIADLETKVADLEKKIAAAPAGAAAQAGPSEADETAAQDLMKKMADAMEKLDFDTAKKLAGEITSKYGSTKAARTVARMKSELDVIGKDAPSLAVQNWYQGETALDDGKATLLVFWEVWCPHCKREVPKLEATYGDWKDKGLQVVGLTKQTRDITDDQVKEFISANNITYGIAREDGMSMSEAFGVRGVPAAAVVKDGKIVWRGHPARINEALLTSWTEG